MRIAPKTLKRAAAAICVAFTVLYCVISFTPIVTWTIIKMEPDWYDGPADVLVVLGGSMLVSDPGAPPIAGQSTYIRSIYAAWIFHQHPVPKVIVTGAFREAEAMRSILISQGVDQNRIEMEEDATTTYENALYVKKLLGDRVPSITLVTSDYHAARALRTFRKLGMHAHAVPVPDLLKSAGSFRGRWPAALEVSTELVKAGYYRLHYGI